VQISIASLREMARAKQSFHAKTPRRAKMFQGKPPGKVRNMLLSKISLTQTMSWHIVSRRSSNRLVLKSLRLFATLLVPVFRII
jgi:hypothetical protein